MGPVHQVTVLPAGVQFECSEQDTVLNAAIRRGFALPYGCRKGNCGTCKAQVLDGEVDLETESIYSLSDFERQQGFTLLCSSYALSDLTIEMEGLDARDLDDRLTPPAQLTATVVDVRALTGDIRLLSLALDEPLDFRSGQFAQVNIPGTDVWRSFSMASPASRSTRLDFMIKLVPDGLFSSYLDRVGSGENMVIDGPHGSFWMRPTDRPILMIGGGAGMAPLWGMLQELAERGESRPIRFFYGARTEADLFHLEEIATLAERLPDFAFVPALSHADTRAGEHRTGMVTDVVQREIGRELRDHDAYLCGPPPMIDAALDMLDRYGLEVRTSIFYDKFTAS